MWIHEAFWKFVLCQCNVNANGFARARDPSEDTQTTKWLYSRDRKRVRALRLAPPENDINKLMVRTPDVTHVHKAFWVFALVSCSADTQETVRSLLVSVASPAGEVSTSATAELARWMYSGEGRRLRRM
jgi:hypothetical protein